MGNRNLLTIENMTKSYTERILFQQVSFGLNEGEKVGLIGINGTGKSTFLKIIAGMEQPDEGEYKKNTQISIEYLEQNPIFDENKTILENIIQGKQKRNETWNIEGQAKAMLLKFGISNPDSFSSILSGGQKKRAALVRTLLNPADVLLLDEPTNHLDNDMIEWLEEYLIRYQGAFLMITHDRYFLDQVTNKIVEIDKGKLYTYKTNYTGFLKLKAEREEMKLAAERKNKSLYQQDLEWMMRGARARSTKQKAHIERFEKLRDREKIVQEKKIEMDSLSQRLGKTTIELNHISKSYQNHTLIQDFNYIFLKQDRIGIVGKNGCGKSTLLRIINKIISPDSGEVVIGQTIKIGYFAQETNSEFEKEESTILDYIRNIAEYIETKQGSATASQMLERFLFPRQMQYTKIGRLSGGEKRRLYLLKVLMEAPNILILDEPTNDLDIQTLTILEHYLDDFMGIVIAVSHDRYFLDRIAARIFAFEENGVIRQYEGGYSDYKLQYDLSHEEEKKPAEKEKQSYKQKTARIRFTYQEQKEYEIIEEDIEQLEMAMKQLDNKIEENASNYEKLHQLTEEKQELEQKLEEKTDRWVYLNELAEQIEEQKEKK